MKRKFLVVAIGGTIIAATLSMGVLASTESREAAAGLEELTKEAKSLGLPTRAEDVPINDSVRAEDNASNRLYDAIKADDKDRIGLLIQAGATSACKFPWKPENVRKELEALEPGTLIQELLDSAAADFEANKPSDARRKVHAALRISRHLASFPAIEALEASAKTERQVFEWLGQEMVKRPNDAALMPIVQAETFTARPTSNLLVALRAFFASGHEIAISHRASFFEGVSWLWGQGDFPTDPWGRKAVEARHVQASIALFKALKDARSWPQAMREVQDHTEKWRKDVSRAAYSVRSYADKLEQAPTSIAENEAARRILFVAASAFRYRQLNSRFPAASPVQGDMAKDPFTGEPMRFSNPGNGFWLHSVGPDGISEGASTQEGLQFGTEVAFFCSGEPITGPAP